MQVHAVRRARGASVQRLSGGENRLGRVFPAQYGAAALLLFRRTHTPLGSTVVAFTASGFLLVLKLVPKLSSFSTTAVAHPAAGVHQILRIF